MGQGLRRAAAAGVLAAAALLYADSVGAQTRAAGCLDPATHDDADVLRLAAALADPALCIGEVRVTENGRDWRLIVIANTATPGPLWAVPHDDEDAGFTTAVAAVLRYGGTIVAVENGGARLVGGQDPNLAFAADAAAAGVCPGARAVAPAYVAAFLAPWDRRFPVIGLHSNWDGHLAGGGLGAISVRRADAKMIPFPSAVATGRFADEDTIAMLVSARLPAANAAGQATVRLLNEAGVHVIYRHVTPANNECTLADYLTLNRLGPYINLEVEHGDAATQAVLVDRLMLFLAAFPYRDVM